MKNRLLLILDYYIEKAYSYASVNDQTMTTYEKGRIEAILVVLLMEFNITENELSEKSKYLLNIINNL